MKEGRWRGEVKGRVTFFSHSFIGPVGLKYSGKIGETGRSDLKTTKNSHFVFF